MATGENAEEVRPGFEGMGEFSGPIVHTSKYKTGERFCGKRVLVVGCGNSGMEVCLDLCNYDAQPSLVVRDSVSTPSSLSLPLSPYFECLQFQHTIFV